MSTGNRLGTCRNQSTGCLHVTLLVHLLLIQGPQKRGLNNPQGLVTSPPVRPGDSTVFIERYLIQVPLLFHQ